MENTRLAAVSGNPPMSQPEVLTMPDMTRDQYMAALRATMHIKNPTVEQMLTVCPHLTREQALEALMGTGDGFVALPPLKIRHSFRTARYFRGHAGLDLPPSFTGGQFSQRTNRSYAEGRPQGDIFLEYPFMEEAMAYAEEHWPEALVLDDWIDFQEVFVQDPTDIVDGSFGPAPRTKFVIGIGLGRYWNELINDRSRPQVELWDDAIAITSVDRLVSSELRGGRGAFTEYNCAYCGGGLSLSYCSACLNRFPDDYFRCGWSTPLAPRLVQLLRDNGHEFALDPERLLVG